MSTRAGGYHRANNLREMYRMHDALINLATESAADKKTMMSQCKTIADHTASVDALTQQLHQESTLHNRGSTIPVDRQGKANSKWENGRQVRDIGGYCWTHGHYVEIRHDDMMCRSKRDFHRENATRADNMKGNQYGNPRA